MNEKRKPFKTLAEDLRAIRRRPIPQEDIDRFNKIMEEEEKYQQEKSRQVPSQGEKNRKIAKSHEADR